MSDNTYPVKRDLDGVYFRVMRDGKPYNRCFTDLTTAERDEFLELRDEKALRRMCHLLADCVRDIGDQFDIVRGKEGDGE